MIRVADAPRGRVVVDVMPRHAPPTSLTVPSCCVQLCHNVSFLSNFHHGVSVSRTQNQGNVIQIQFQPKLSGWVGRRRVHWLSVTLSQSRRSLHLIDKYASSRDTPSTGIVLM
jgi:hypothetical protein